MAAKAAFPLSGIRVVSPPLLCKKRCDPGVGFSFTADCQLIEQKLCFCRQRRSPSHGKPSGVCPVQTLRKNSGSAKGQSGDYPSREREGSGHPYSRSGKVDGGDFFLCLRRFESKKIIKTNSRLCLLLNRSS
jgi:hypothetical protein